MEYTEADRKNDYEKVSNMQKALTVEMSTLKKRFETFTDEEKNLLAQTIFEKQEQLMSKFRENDKFINEIIKNHEEMFKNRSYFTTNLKKETELAHSGFLRDLQAFFKDEDEEEEEDNEDESKKEKARHEREMKKMQEKFAKLEKKLRESEQRGGGSSNANQVYIKDKIDFPKFPKDQIEYRTYRSSIEMWFKTEDPYCLPERKFSYLKISCEGHEAANKIVGRYEVDDEAYEKAIIELDRRFMNVKNVCYDILESMISIRPYRKGSNTGQHLTYVYDTFKHLQNNLEMVIKKHALPDGTKSEIRSEMLDSIFGALIMRAIDDPTRTHIASKLDLETHEIPNPKELLKIIETRFINLRSVVETPCVNQHNEPTKHQKVSAAKTNDRSINKAKKSTCLLCEKPGHEAKTCRDLLNLSASERLPYVKTKGICTNCMEAKKGKCECYKGEKKPGRCNRCTFMHHDILHDGNWKPQTKVRVSAAITEQPTLRVSINPTALIKVKAANGRVIMARCLIDTGATVTLMTYALANQLGAPKEKIVPAIEVATYTGQKGGCINHRVQVIIKPHFEDKFEMALEANLTTELGGLYPANSVLVTIPKKNQHIKLADPEFNKSGKIDMILGVGEYQGIKSQSKRGYINLQNLALEETELGFLVFGKSETPSHKVTVATVVTGDQENLDRYFEYVEVEQEKDVYVETLYKESVKRDDEGYIVKIPWKDDVEIGESKNITMGRVRRMLKGMTPEVLASYIKICEEMKANGYMKIVDPFKTGKCYFANFALKTNSLTTPVRLILTCDQRTTNGVSLNDMQHVGNKLQKELPGCLLKLRINEIAVTSDISKMYLQIRLDENDVDYQRTFIGKSAMGPLEEVELPRVTFGMRSAPWLALRTILQLADDEQQTYPIAAKLLRNNFYIDDLLVSFEDKLEATRAIEELSKATEKGHFPLRKWASNELSVLKNIPKAHLLETANVELDKEEFTITEDIKVLGIIWNKITDELHYFVKLHVDEIVTKRKATSTVAKIYDPVGILAPAMMVGKLLIQKIWKHDKEDPTRTWDSPTTKEIESEFKQWQQELPLLQQIRVPRWLQEKEGNSSSIVLFTDASQSAYACVAYWRTVTTNGSVKVTIMGARAKVTPMSQKFVPHSKKDDLTLPRLELMAAELGAQYVGSCKEALNLPKTFPVVAFSDSKITLAWIQGNVTRWSVFVANRVKRIIDVIPQKNWHYVNTKENPADLPSRGITPKDLVSNEIWFQGPAFIHENPLECNNDQFLTTKDEVQRQAVVKTRGETTALIEIMEKISTWGGTVRIIAYVLRFITCVKACNGVGKTLKGLTVDECVKAETLIVKEYQEHYYAAERACVKENLPIKNAGPLKNVTLIMDSKDLLRIKGRLGKSKIYPYNEKHPMVLPPLDIPSDKDQEDSRKCTLTKKLIMNAHLTTLHGGELKTLSVIRQRFHIPNGRRAIRYILYRCVLCRTMKPTFYQQVMGELPESSLTPGPPFLFTTLDYAGPIDIKCGARGRNKNKDGERYKAIYGKGWIAVFVCRVTGAYHFELVESLTAIACLEAFKRFVATRGLPQRVRTDNASTFIKASKILKQEEREANEIAVHAIVEGHEEIKRVYATKKVELNSDDQDVNHGCPVMLWLFNPPLAPNFGGKHEAAVKQMKIHLKKMVCSGKLTYAALMTVLKQCEAALNSRPLCKVEGRVGERDFILTPAHFLIQRTLFALPEPDYSLDKTSIANRYTTQQKMVQQFWKTFRNQYLNQLQNSPKWLIPEKNIEIGEIVLLKEENTPPLTWRKAVVEKLFPGEDGKVRVVEVKDAGQKVFKRSVRKLVKLPVSTRPQMAFEKTESSKKISPPEPETSKTISREKKISPPEPETSKKISREKKISPPEPETSKKISRERKISPPEPETSKKISREKKISPPEPRRSKRVTQAPKRYVSTLLTILCICCVSKLTDATQVQPINQAGLMVMKEGDVMLRVGTHHLKINTNLNIEKNLQEIRKHAEYAITLCETSHSTNDVKCAWKLEQLIAAQNRVEKTIMAMGEPPVQEMHSKKKRNTGFLVKLFRWFFGSNSAGGDEEHSHSMGVVTHAVRAFSIIEKQLTERTTNIQSSMRKIQEEYSKKSKQQQQKLNLQKLEKLVVEIIEETTIHMEEVNKAYQSITNELISLSEFETAIQKIPKTNLAGVPNLQFDQLQKITTTEFKINKDKDVELIIGIPMTSSEIYERYLVLPVPNKNDMIANATEQEVIVNHLEKRYIINKNLLKINETLTITKDTLKRSYKLSKQTDCVTRSVITANHECSLVKIKTPYDVWHETPLHNTVLFYSTEPKELFCPTYRGEISEKVGLLAIPEGCHIETETFSYYASLDKTSVIKNAFYIAWNDKTINETQTKTQEDEIIETKFDLIDDAILEVVLTEAKGENIPWGWISATAALATILVVIVVVMLYIKKKTTIAEPDPYEVVAQRQPAAT